MPVEIRRIDDGMFVHRNLARNGDSESLESLRIDAGVGVNVLDDMAYDKRNVARRLGTTNRMFLGRKNFELSVGLGDERSTRLGTADVEPEIMCGHRFYLYRVVRVKEIKKRRRVSAPGG